MKNVWRKLEILYNTLDRELERRRQLRRPGHKGREEGILLNCILKK
jgi:hypothetical protein